IGTDPSGDTGLGNGARGIYLEGADTLHPVMGTTIIGNVSSGNGVAGAPFYAGIRADYDAGTVIQNNLLGTDPTGTKALGNLGYGIHLYFSAGDTVSGNTIADNGFNSGQTAYNGIFGQSDTSTQIVGNKIGTDKTGEVALGNAAYGVQLSGSS